MTTRRLALLGAVLLAGLAALPVEGAAKELPLGTPVTRQEAGLVITAAYGPPLAVEGLGLAGKPLFVPASAADLFLAVDVRAARGNRNGFGAGEFVPYLSISYTLGRPGGRVQKGELHPVVTAEGVRYGNNVKLPGSGPYTLTLTVEPPVKVGFGRHTDAETGVARWWQPVQVEWTLKQLASVR